MVGGCQVADLPGWHDDDLVLAGEAYDRTVIPGWPRRAGETRGFFETAFRAGRATDGLLTGYFEPEIEGALHPSDQFPVPLYSLPPGLLREGTGPERRQIEIEGLARGYEIAWVADPLDAFLAQVQGSLRVRLPKGDVLRLGYAAGNGRPYRSIGAELVRTGAIPESEVSIQAIRRWCAANPDEVTSLLHVNPSFVFFRVLDLDARSGPIGAAGVPVTAMRSIAADTAFIAIGTPVWLQVHCPGVRSRLVIVQDTGSGIVGPGRADLFIGIGAAAGEQAGRLKHGCSLIPLVPQ